MTSAGVFLKHSRTLYDRVYSRCLPCVYSLTPIVYPHQAFIIRFPTCHPATYATPVIYDLNVRTKLQYKIRLQFHPNARPTTSNLQTFPRVPTSPTTRSRRRVRIIDEEIDGGTMRSKFNDGGSEGDVHFLAAMSTELLSLRGNSR